MYQDYWQLATKPFEPYVGTEVEGWYFPSEPHEGASLKLRYALDSRRTAMAIAGPIGVGKTMLIHRVIADLDEPMWPIAHVVFPQMSGRELLAYLADELQAPPVEDPRWTIDESLRRIENWLATNQAEGRHALVVVDEAHLLEESGSLETLRLLLNLGDGKPAMSLLLIGQMSLLSALGRTPALEDRIAVRSLLRTFTSAETAEYIGHRMQAAGADREIFTTNAINTIHQLAGGAPRSINRLADLALIIGFAEQLATIDAAHINSVSQELLSVTPG